MLIDHVGIMLFPEITALRVIGRLSFPIYAFMIAEGCKYTKNKLRYFLGIFGLAAVCQIVFYISSSSLQMGILVNFSLSILCIYALQYMKKTVIFEKSSNLKKLGAIAAFFAAFVGTYMLFRIFEVDYGFLGCMVPVFASIFESEEELPFALRRLGIIPVRVITMSLCLLVFILVNGGYRNFALFSIPLLLLYSGKRGKLKMKYLFYVFYPLHLALIYFISEMI